MVSEERKNEDGSSSILTYRVTGSGCECRKREQSGIPCSHYIAMLQYQSLELRKEHIDQRWILDDETLSLEELDLGTLDGNCRTRDSVSAAQIRSVNGRYVLILSQAKVLAMLGSQRGQTFEYLMEKLKVLETEILTQNDTVVIDDHGTRIGRKPAKTKGKR